MKLWKIVLLYGWQLLNRIWITQITGFIQMAVWNDLKHITLLSYHPAIIILAESLIRIFSKQSMLWVQMCLVNVQRAKPCNNHFSGFIKPLWSLHRGHVSIGPLLSTLLNICSIICHITVTLQPLFGALLTHLLWGIKSLFSRAQTQDIKSKQRRWHYSISEEEIVIKVEILLLTFAEQHTVHWSHAGGKKKCRWFGEVHIQ